MSRLTCRDVRVFLEGCEILRGVDLDLDRPGLVGLLGPNGCGKSTWLRALYRAVKPSGGALLLDEWEYGRWRARDFARHVAVLPQQERSAFDMTVMEMVVLGRVPWQKFGSFSQTGDSAIALRALAAVDLEGFENRSFLSLSGGERQRVLFARALCQQTPLLLLDEPTNHLDVRHQLSVLRLAASLPKITLSALHDLTLASCFCRHLIVMNRGSVVASGSPGSVLTPDLIRDVWGVNSSVERDGDRVYVRYLID